MDRETLKKIIVDEVRRALAAPPASHAGSSLSPSSPSARPPGLIVFTGSAAPCADALAALADASAAGFSLRAIASQSFEGAVLSKSPSGVGKIEIDGAPRCEIALAGIIDSARWLLLPGASPNTLAKAALGIRDSAPSTAIGLALDRERACLFLESRSPGVAAESTSRSEDRQEHLRRLEHRGARVVWPETLLATLDSLFPLPSPRVFEPPPPRRWQRRVIITAEDVWEIASAGGKELAAPADAIVTPQAEEEAVRRGIILRREASR